MHAGRNQYPPGRGIPELREASRGTSSATTASSSTRPSRSSSPTGATEAIAAAMLGLVDPGDEVVVLEPYYDSYVAMIQMAGGVRRPVTLRAPDFRLDLDELGGGGHRPDPADPAEHARTTRPARVLRPRGARGRSPTSRVEHDLVVVTDEVYEHLTFDGHEHVPIATLPGMFERTVTISSPGKTFSFTGWKVGWVTGPAELVAAVEGAKKWLTFSSGAPFQPAIAHALDHEAAFHEQLREGPRSSAATCSATASTRWAWTCTSRRAPTS